MPTGLGMGATQLAWAVRSSTRAAGSPPIITEEDPFEIIPGPAGMHAGRTHGAVLSVSRAAGCPPMSTVGSPAGKMGPPTWGTVPVTMGHTCISVILAAGGILF